MSTGRYPAARPYLQALEKAGRSGFVPIGWLYCGIMEDLVAKGLAEQSGPDGAYVLSRNGTAELKSHQSLGSCAGCMSAAQHIQALHELISSAAPEGWAASGDLAGANDWSKRAVELMASWASRE